MDTETRRKKQQAMMLDMLTRKVRTRAQQIYDSRGRIDGQALDHWIQAESEVLENSILAPLYRRMQSENAEPQSVATPLPDLDSADSSVC